MISANGYETYECHVNEFGALRNMKLARVENKYVTLEKLRTA